VSAGYIIIWLYFLYSHSPSNRTGSASSGSLLVDVTNSDGEDVLVVKATPPPSGKLSTKESWHLHSLISLATSIHLPSFILTCCHSNYNMGYSLPMAYYCSYFT